MTPDRASLTRTANPLLAVVGLLVLLLGGVGAMASTAGHGAITAEIAVEDGRLSEPAKLTRHRRRSTRARRHPRRCRRHRSPVAGGAAPRVWP